MEHAISTTLKRWESSLTNFGKVDQWNINEDYSILRAFISSGKPTEARNAIRDCRDYSIRNECDVATLLSKVQNANRILNKQNNTKINREMKKIHSGGQLKRFVSTTKKLYKEKLKFKDGEYLKNIDISIEDGATSRKVRRIVEKRMCQSYHRQNKNIEREGGRNRYHMKSATSFQLHNLGQIECSIGFYRSNCTHWKKSFDPIVGKFVFKKKLEYSSFEEANIEAQDYIRRNPDDTKPVIAYKCAFCGKWHIGHTTSDVEKTHTDMVTCEEMAS